MTLMNTTRSTGLPEKFDMITSTEITAAVALVRECTKGERVVVFGVECECTRRGWFQIVGGVKHELRSSNLVKLIANMPSLRRDAITRTAREVAAEMFGAPSP